MRITRHRLSSLYFHFYYYNNNIASSSSSSFLYKHQRRYLSSSDEKVRLNKLLSQRNVCSRREADDYIERGWVFVNGEKAEMGLKISLDAKVELHENAKKKLNRNLNIIMNKPYSFLSQSSNPLPRQRFAKDLLTWKNHDRKCVSHRELKQEPRGLRKLSVAGRLVRTKRASATYLRLLIYSLFLSLSYTHTHTQTHSLSSLVGCPKFGTLDFYTKWCISETYHR